MTEWENFPNPPVRLVSFELRFPVRRRIATRPVWDAFEEGLTSDLPNVESFVREGDDAQLPVHENDLVLRRSNVDRDWAVTLRYNGVTVETTAYVSYGGLRKCIDSVLLALESVPWASPTRLGLRYINEIRVPGASRILDWRPYVNPCLLSPLNDHPVGYSASYLQAGLGFHSLSGPEHTYAHYGPLPDSPLEPDDVLQLKEIDGPCFILDIDSFVSGTAKSPVAATRKEVLDVVDRLHDAVEAVFNWSITERLREEVLRVPPSETEEGAERAGDRGA
ncbi:TIGR04255 family protein [Phytohabitans maris]|uniref:TIGR04255 family protein n=1 Tax=Phytohabitans maris TaxID=3071409 RepID=UPI003D178917